MSDVRKIATEILQKVLEEKVFFTELKNTDDLLESKDLAFYNMLILTSLRHLIFYQTRLEEICKKEIARRNFHLCNML